MILIKIRKRFRERASEWYCAANLFAFGSTLLHPSTTFTSPAYAAFESVATEAQTGAFCAVVGLLWLVGLIVNGQMQLTTSAVRAVCAAIGGVVYGLLCIGFAGSYYFTGVLSTGIGNYFLVSVLAFYCLFWTMKTARTPH